MWKGPRQPGKLVKRRCKKYMLSWVSRQVFDFKQKSKLSHFFFQFTCISVKGNYLVMLSPLCMLKMAGTLNLYSAQVGLELQFLPAHLCDPETKLGGYSQLAIELWEEDLLAFSPVSHVVGHHPNLAEISGRQQYLSKSLSKSVPGLLFIIMSSQMLDILYCKQCFQVVFSHLGTGFVHQVAYVSFNASETWIRKFFIGWLIRWMFAPEFI